MSSPPLPSSPAPSPGLIRALEQAPCQTDPAGAPPVHPAPLHLTPPHFNRRTPLHPDRTPLHPLHPIGSIPSPQPGPSRVQPCHPSTPPAPPYLSGAWPGPEPGKGRWCPARSRAASGPERGQRLPCPPLSLLAGEEPGYSQPLVCSSVCAGCVCVCVCAAASVCAIPPARGHRKHRAPQASPHPKDASSCIPGICPRPWYP